MQLTSFVGRERELAEVARLLLERRQLTLTGAGGSGKTRLALEVASRLLKGFQGGVWVVELANLSNAELVPQVTATALSVSESPGRSPAESLVDYLKPRHALLVLDNCEHLVEACAQLAETLLKACPNLRILATSREPLRTAGEVLWPVPGLSLPDHRRLPAIENLLRYEAIQLFIDRARSVQPNFEASEENASALAQVCRRLDGMPLAIELAAARVRMLSVEQIASRLDDSLGLLSGGLRTGLTRHQTLKATLDWSYDLLLGKEQLAFRRLAVFAGGFSLEAAEAVCAGEDMPHSEVLGLLSALIDKSLVAVEEQPGKAVRYRLLEPIRQYSADRLQTSGEETILRQRHRDWYLALAQEAGSKLNEKDQALWMGKLEAEHDNLRAALAWSQQDPHGVEPGLRLANVLVMFWQMRGYYSEGRRWLGALLSRGSDVAVSIRASAISSSGFMAIHSGDFPQARADWEQALRLYQELGDSYNTGQQLMFLAHVAQHEHDLAQAAVLGRQSLELQRTASHPWGISNALFALGDTAYAAGDFNQAATHLEEAVAIARELGNLWGLGRRLVRLGQVCLRQDDPGNATALILEGLALCRGVGDNWGTSMAIIGMAGAHARNGNMERTARLLGAVERLMHSTGAALWMVDQLEFESILAKVRNALTEEQLAGAWAQGQAMSLEEAGAYAQDQVDRFHSGPARHAGLPEPPPEVEPAGMTPRELEVLRLIATGRSNQKIAEELVISVRTVERHISNIYGKIGVDGSTARAAATAYAFSHGLALA